MGTVRVIRNLAQARVGRAIHKREGEPEQERHTGCGRGCPLRAIAYPLAPTPGTALPKADTRYLRYLSSRRFSEFDCLPASAQLQGVEADLQAQERTPILLLFDHPRPKAATSSFDHFLHRKKLKKPALPQDSLPALPTLPAQSRGRMRARDT